MTERPTPLSENAAMTDPTAAARRSFGAAFERLVGIMAKLRGPGGCPWDREQSLETLKPYLIEEAYEVIEAIDSAGTEHHQEELGDLLLQVVFQSELQREAGHFDAADVTHGISDKLVRRHPHVFGDGEADGTEAVLEQWEQIKSKEKGGRSIVAGVPKALPGLLRAQRLSDKASRVGFDFTAVEGALAKVDEERAELQEALSAGEASEVFHELGDLLFAVTNVARKLDISAEEALQAASTRFMTRFQKMEADAAGRGAALSDHSAEDLERLWEAAKR